jgi:hypothetical protein
MAWQNSNKISDTPVDDSGCNNTYSCMFSRLNDDDCENNYWIFKDIKNTKVSNISKLTNSANRSAWNFQISNLNIGGTSISTDGWKLYITNTIKILSIYLKNKGSSITFRWNDKKINEHKSVIVFPSYLEVNLVDCDVYFANGSSFY